MSEQINISKIKIRRGLDSERLQVILDNGELGFTTDTQRLFVGDGVTKGGVPAANKFAGTFATAANVTTIEEGDYVIINGSLYIFNGGDKSNIANYLSLSNVGVDNTTIAYNAYNQLYVKSILNLLGSSIDGNKGLYITPGSTLGVNVDNISIIFDGQGKLTIGSLTGNQHGNLGGGTLHTVATALLPGFMSAADKVKLDDSPVWTLSALTNSQALVVANAINQYNNCQISNVGGISSVNLQTPPYTVNVDYFLNQQNQYNETVQPGSILYSALDSSKISNVGELAQWTIDSSSIASFPADTAFVLGGGDGYMYGFYLSAPSYTLPFTDNIVWNMVSEQTTNSLMAAISTVVSQTPTGYKVFDVYPITSTSFVVKSLYPNYCYWENNIGGTTNITITQDTPGKQSASLSRKFVCNTTISNVVPVSGSKTTIVININSGANGTAVDANNNNRALTIYNSDYSKNVFYFYNPATPTSIPSINVNAAIPGLVTNLYPVTYNTSDTVSTVVNALTSQLSIAGFEVISKTSFNVIIKTQTPGYCLDVFTNYNSSVISTVGKGGGGSDGDLFTLDNSYNGVPRLYSLIPTCGDIITNDGSPAVQNIVLPGVPAVVYTTQSSTRNSVALIKY